MYYCINKEPYGSYLTEKNVRVALLSYENVPAGYRPRFTELENDEEATEHFKLTYAPLPEPEPEE